jgi:hypothetical protein
VQGGLATAVGVGAALSTTFRRQADSTLQLSHIFLVSGSHRRARICPGVDSYPRDASRAPQTR